MNKIYLVYETYDYYDEKYEFILKAFFDKNKAEEFRIKKVKQLEEAKAQYKKYCSKCTGTKQYKDCNKYETDMDNDCINEICLHDITGIHYYIGEVEVE